MFFGRMAKRTPAPSDPAPIRFLDDRPVRCQPWWLQRQSQRSGAQSQQQTQARAVAPPVAPVAPVAPKPPAPVVAAPVPPTAPKKSRSWPIGTLAFLGVLVGGYVAHEKGLVSFGDAEAREEVSNSFDVSDNPLVVVETFNGPIEVKRGVSGKVEAVVIKRASAKTQEQADSELERMPVSMGQEGETVRIVAKGLPALEGANTGASVRVTVPMGAAVRLKSENGSIHVERTAGPVEAETANGAIDLDDVRGALALTSHNGSIDCKGLDAVVTADASNGSVRFRGSLAPGASRFQTQNGSVRLALPEGQSFAIDAKTDHGKVESEFKVKAEGTTKGKRVKHLVGTVGDLPSSVVTIRTGNGEIELEELDD